MVTIPTIKMVMTGGCFSRLSTSINIRGFPVATVATTCFVIWGFPGMAVPQKIDGLPSAYLTYIAMERSTIFKNGKPSISIRAIYTMAMLVITRGLMFVMENPPQMDDDWGYPYDLENLH